MLCFLDYTTNKQTTVAWVMKFINYYKYKKEPGRLYCKGRYSIAYHYFNVLWLCHSIIRPLKLHINHRRVHYLSCFADEKAPPLQCKFAPRTLFLAICVRNPCVSVIFLWGLSSFCAVNQYCNPTFESLSVSSIIFPCFYLIPVRIFSLCTCPPSSSSYFAYFLYAFRGKRFYKRFARSSCS